MADDTGESVRILKHIAFMVQTVALLQSSIDFLIHLSHHLNLRWLACQVPAEGRRLVILYGFARLDALCFWARRLQHAFPDVLLNNFVRHLFVCGKVKPLVRIHTRKPANEV